MRARLPVTHVTVPAPSSCYTSMTLPRLTFVVSDSGSGVQFMRQLQAGAVKAGPARHGERMMTRGASGAAYYPAGGQAASSGRLPLGRYLPRARELGGAVPPSGLALLSIVSVQIGAAIAKNLFHLLGPGGAVFLRTGVAAVVLLAIWRPRVRGHAAADFRAMILFGLVIAAMNTAFYSAIARLPL